MNYKYVKWDTFDPSKKIILRNSSLLRFDHFLIFLEVRKRAALFSEIPLAYEFFSCNILLTSKQDKSFTITGSFISSTAIIFEITITKDILRTCGAKCFFLKTPIHKKKTHAHAFTYDSLMIYVTCQQKVHLNLIYNIQTRCIAIKTIISSKFNFLQYCNFLSMKIETIFYVLLFWNFAEIVLH